MATTVLKNISEIRRFFHRNEDPVYFISATNFNLLGLDEWVKNFKYICYIDCYGGKHPNVFCPSEQPHAEFQSIEDINNYLLQHKEVIDFVKRRGGKPKFVFLMFDEETERLSKELGADVWFPKAKLRQKMDNKIETVRIGNKAGVPSVPNVLAEVKDYEDLKKTCEKAGIGHDLVLQSAFGDSGHTTFFIKSEADFRRHESEIVGEGEIKIMKRIDCRGSAIEACCTSEGTIVGPLMTELVARVRALLQAQGARRNRELLLGVRVCATLEECHNQGLDVPTWIARNLLDYVAPADTMYAELNAPYEEFAALTRASDCLLYPGMLPWSSIRARRRLADRPISLEQQRALVQNFYGAGADGFSVYNHFVPLHWAPFYPMMLEDLDEVREPERLDRGRRHYVFEPILAGSIGFGKDRAETGAIKADKIMLERQSQEASGHYRFRMCEDLSTVRRAALLFRAFHMTEADQIDVWLNDTPISSQALRRRSDEARPDAMAPVDIDTKTSLGLPLVPDPEGPCTTYYFELQSPPAVYGDNYLQVKLQTSDPDAAEDIVIDEIEVMVVN